MKNTMIRTYPAEGDGVNRVDVKITYKLGNLYGSRGYYFIITPYKHEVRGGMVFNTFHAYAGLRGNVLPCQRQSKKRFEEACSHMDELVAKYLQGVLDENGVTITGEYTETIE